MTTPPQPKPFVNRKVNNALETEERVYYSGQQPHVNFWKVAKYSSNNALFFYVIANVLTSYYLARYYEGESNEKYIYMALSLYITQIIYNYLDINDKTNLDRLEATD